MKKRSLDDGSVLYVDAQGVMQSHRLGDGVVLHVRRGIMGADFARYVTADGERELATAGRCVFMVDGYETKMHTTEFRETMTEWIRAHDGTTVHMLIKSRMLEMALNVANLAMGVRRARSYFNVEEWVAAGKREVPSFRRRPLFIPSDLERRA